MPNRSGYAQIDITVDLENDGACSMSIADNGIGIPADIKQYIFKEGFRYGTTGNTGLGLYIARVIMDRYGSIDVKDNVPSGAAFILKFKRSRKDGALDEKTVPAI